MEKTISDALLERMLRLVSGVSYIFMGQPVLADVDRIVDEFDIADGDATIIAQPDIPRNVTGTLTDADDSVTATVTIRGKDAHGRFVQEVMQITLGEGKTFVGTKIFAKVDQVAVSGTTGGAAGDTLAIGVGDLIGLPNDIAAEEEILFTFVGGAQVTPDEITTGESTSGIDANSATYDGTKVMYAIARTSPAQ